MLINKKSIIVVLILQYFLISNTIIAQTCDNNIEKSTPDERFVINNGNDTGTVTDLKTGLMWKQCFEGLDNNCQGKALDMNWRNAIKAASDATFAWHTDWRIPSKKELSSIVETACKDPAINQNIFPGNNNVFVWSSTQYITRKYYFSWGVGFDNGDDAIDFQVSNNKVRLVRGDLKGN